MSGRSGSKMASRAIVVFLLVFSLLYLFPTYWIISSSVKIGRDLFSWPPTFFPTRITLTNFEDAFATRPLSFYIRNSLIVTCMAVILCLIIGVPAAYSLSRLGWSPKVGENIARWIVSLRMLPPIAAALPLYLVFSKLHLLDTFQGLILGNLLLNLPFTVWMMRGFFGEVPRETEEAARMDGCGPLQTLTRIAIPLVRPGLVATMLFAVVFSWNEFMFAVKFSSSHTMTLPVLISTFVLDKGILFGQMSAAGTISLIPVFALVLVAQRNIVAGLTLGSVH